MTRTLALAGSILLLLVATWLPLSATPILFINPDPPFLPGGFLPAACCGGGTATFPQNNSFPAVWTGPDVGWFFMPSSTLSAVNSIQTVFFSVIPATPVELVVYTGFNPTTGLPCGSQAGCSTIANATFTALAGSYSGPTFAPVNLTAGTKYFIGYHSVNGFGTNITNGAGATNLEFWFHGIGDRTFVQGPAQSAPILRFDTNVPEPGTIGLFLTGGVALFAFRLVRRRLT